MADKMYLYQGYLYAAALTESLLRADAVQRYARCDASHHMDGIADELKALADHLGYDLGKREAVKIEEAA